MNNQHPIDNLIADLDTFLNTKTKISEEIIKLVRNNLAAIYKQTELDYKSITVGFLIAHNYDHDTAFKIANYIEYVYDYWLIEKDV